MYEKKGIVRVVKLGERKAKLLKGVGGNKKTVLLSCNTANVIDKKGKSKKTNIKNVIETDLGKARITNRPSQESTVQAILVD